MRIHTRFRPRRAFPDLTPAQREAGLRAASTADLEAAVLDIETHFPVWQRSAQLREAYAIMVDELLARRRTDGQGL